MHGGGPTAVLNASLAGVVDACREHATVLYGARFGRLTDDMPDLLQLSPERVRSIGRTAGSFLGSNRKPVNDDWVDVLKRLEVDVLFSTGGNGTMAGALAMSHQTQLQVIGIPKTIDNDLLVTDHTPGYASTATFFACAARDVGIDNRSLPSPVCILETLGRNCGWVAAATSFARAQPDDADDAPHLIYFPERLPSLDRIASDVEGVYRRLGRVVVAVCEGEPPTNVGYNLAQQLTAKLGIRARSEKPGLLGRSSGIFAREGDRRDSYVCGRAAVLAAAAGETRVMVALRHDSSTFLTPLETVAGKERRFPLEWISPEGNDVTPGFRAWAQPLIGDLPI